MLLVVLELPMGLVSTSSVSHGTSLQEPPCAQLANGRRRLVKQVHATNHLQPRILKLQAVLALWVMVRFSFTSVRTATQHLRLRGALQDFGTTLPVRRFRALKILRPA